MSQEPEVEHPAPHAAKEPESTWRILFLDSAEHNALLKEACKEFGYVVASASSTAEAWLFLNGKDHVDVIVCAAHLEHDSMFAFLREVRHNETHGNAAFLILSLEPSATGSRLDSSAASAGLILGANEFLVMPTFDAAALVRSLRSLQPRVPALQVSAHSAGS